MPLRGKAPTELSGTGSCWRLSIFPILCFQQHLRLHLHLLKCRSQERSQEPECHFGGKAPTESPGITGVGACSFSRSFVFIHISGCTFIS